MESGNTGVADIARAGGSAAVVAVSAQRLDTGSSAGGIVSVDVDAGGGVEADATHTTRRVCIERNKYYSGETSSMSRRCEVLVTRRTRNT